MFVVVIVVWGGGGGGEHLGSSGTKIMLRGPIFPQLCMGRNRKQI